MTAPSLQPHKDDLLEILAADRCPVCAQPKRRFRWTCTPCGVGQQQTAEHLRLSATCDAHMDAAEAFLRLVRGDADVKLVALIPARAGSQRVPGKNTRLLAGYPLIAYTIAAAQQSGVFNQIVVATDDGEAMAIGRTSGVLVFDRAPVSHDQPDIDWVSDVLAQIACDAFAILRPTSPFRSAAEMRRAWALFQWWQPADSLRAIRRVTEHPAKMWTIESPSSMRPFVDHTGHSQPTQSLPPVYVQTSSLEIAWTKTVYDTGTISGTRILPFVCEGPEALAIDTWRDWAEAERLVATGQAQLPTVALASVSATPAP